MMYDFWSAGVTGGDLWTIDLWAKVIFIVSTLLFAYHHLAFPMLLGWLARRQRARMLPAARSHVEHASGNRRKTASGAPSITLIVPAHNEQALIGEKIRNLAALDYPRDRLRIVVALDGCTDETEALATLALQAAGNPGHIELVVHQQNRGKLALLNHEIERAQSDIVTLSDVSAVVSPDALLRGSRHFASDSVGVVCATYKLKVPGSRGEAKYWEFQTRLKAAEAVVAAPMGAHGAFYMFRRACWQPLPGEIVNDDFVLPMRIVAAGYRAIYDEDIVAWELEQTVRHQEFARRVRIGAGNLQQLVMFGGLLNPWRRQAVKGGVSRGRLAFVFGSGKALRVLIPFIAIAGAVACLYLAAMGYGLFASIAISGAVVTALGIYAIYNPGPNIPKALAWLGYLIEGHFASLVGAIHFMRGHRSVAWSAKTSASGGGHRNYIPLPIRIAKRAFDVVFSAIALLLLWPLFIPIAVAIKLESRGPVFYRQRRVGRISPNGAEEFELIKFRTMGVDAEKEAGAQWAVKNDPRITRVGLFLRKTRLDELPQFINVLTGKMSLVGPRPERPQLVDKLEEALPHYAERTYGLRPGITGLAQINQGYDETIEDVRNKLLYDHAYAAHLSRPLNWIKMDSQILFGTVWVMLTGRGQ